MSSEDRNDAAQEHGTGEEEGTGSGGGAFSLWGLGASVLGNVQKNTATFVNTIVETDWQKELQEIQDGLRTETAELEKDIGSKLGIAPAEHATAGSTASRAAPAAPDTDGVSIADIGRRFLTGTAEIFQQVRSTVDNEFTSLEQEATKKSRSSLPRGGREGGAKFSRLDMKVSAMQRNSATYCDEPDDAAAFSAFLEGYDQEGRTAQAAEIFSSNPFMSELHSRLVPLVITDDTFWQRYFFRLQKLTQEYEKVQERLQQAHRRASKQDLDADPLDSLSGAFGKPDASPATSPLAAPASVERPQHSTPVKTPVDEREQLEVSGSPKSPPQRPQTQGEVAYDGAAAGGGADAAAETPALNQEHEAQGVTGGYDHDGDDNAQQQVAECGDAASAQGMGGAAAGAPEGVAKGGLSEDRTQPSGNTGDVAVGVAGGDGEEAGDSGRSSGNGKISSDWSVVSPIGNGTATAAGSPQGAAQAERAEPVPTEAQEAAAKPALAASGETTPDAVTEAGEAAAEEDVDFDDLEAGLDDAEDGDEDGDDDGEGEDEELDDNWGWE